MLACLYVQPFGTLTRLGSSASRLVFRAALPLDVWVAQLSSVGARWSKKARARGEVEVAGATPMSEWPEATQPSPISEARHEMSP